LSTIYYNNDFITALKNYDYNSNIRPLFPSTLFKFVQTEAVSDELKVSAYLVYEDATLSSFNLIQNDTISLYDIEHGGGSAEKPSTQAKIILKGKSSNTLVKIMAGTETVVNKRLTIDSKAEILLSNIGCETITISVGDSPINSEFYSIPFKCRDRN
jgi:hypothetical protein